MGKGKILRDEQVSTVPTLVSQHEEVCSVKSADSRDFTHLLLPGVLRATRTLLMKQQTDLKLPPPPLPSQLCDYFCYQDLLGKQLIKENPNGQSATSWLKKEKYYRVCFGIKGNGLIRNKKKKLSTFLLSA